MEFTYNNITYIKLNQESFDSMQELVYEKEYANMMPSFSALPLRIDDSVPRGCVDVVHRIRMAKR